MSRLEEAPAFKYHLAAGDSLLHGLDQGELDLGAGMSVDRVAANFAYATENLTELRRILQERPVRRRGRQPALHHREGSSA